jgi:hypothetical protein
MGNGTDGPADLTFIQLLVKLKGIQVGFVTDHVFAGGTDEVGADLLLLQDASLDDLQLVTRKCPNATAVTAFASILGKAVSVHVQFHFPALA